jgi:hypothetical protein
MIFPKVNIVNEAPGFQVLVWKLNNSLPGHWPMAHKPDKSAFQIMSAIVNLQ